MHGAMERLIESVRKYPCLWKTDLEEYKLNDVKEAAWREIVKECDLPDGEYFYKLYLVLEFYYGYLLHLGPIVQSSNN